MLIPVAVTQSEKLADSLPSAKTNLPEPIWLLPEAKLNSTPVLDEYSAEANCIGSFESSLRETIGTPRT